MEELIRLVEVWSAAWKWRHHNEDRLKQIEAQATAREGKGRRVRLIRQSQSAGIPFVEDEDLNERVAEAEADESLFWRIFQKREAELLAICRMIDNEYHHLSEHLPRVDPKDQWSADQTEEFARNLSTPTHRDHAGDGAEPVAHP